VVTGSKMARTHRVEAVRGATGECNSCCPKDWRELLLKSLLLSPIAFALWSLVLPGSWWQLRIETLRANPEASLVDTARVRA